MTGLATPTTCAIKPVIGWPKMLNAGLQRHLLGLIVILGFTTATYAQALSPTSEIAPALSVTALINQLKQATAASQARVKIYQQRQAKTHERVLAQEQRNTQEQRDVNRLDQLIEKYSGGKHTVYRLQTIFTRLAKERLRYNNRQILEWEVELQTLTEIALDLDDQLYIFDRSIDSQIKALKTQLAVLTPAQGNAQLNQAKQQLHLQRTALTDEQQALAALSQELSTLISIHGQRKNRLDQSYRLVLAKLFWFRDSHPFNAALIQSAGDGLANLIERLQQWVQARRELMSPGFNLATLSWLPVLFLVIGLPGCVIFVRRYLHAIVDDCLAQDAKHDSFMHKASAAALMIMQTTLWPAYLVLLVWLTPQLLPEVTTFSKLEHAIIKGLQLAAILLWIDLIGKAILLPQGWGQRYWGFSSGASRTMRWALTMGCLGALFLIVPRYILITAPGDGNTTTESLALARVCFILFQTVVAIIIAVACRRSSQLTHQVLSAHRERQTILWRYWPLLHLVILTGFVSILVLSLKGYSYAAQSLWFNSTNSILVIMGLMALCTIVKAFIAHLLRQLPPKGESVIDTTETPFHLAQPSRSFLLQQAQRVSCVVIVLVGIWMAQSLYQFDEALFKSLNAITLFKVATTAAGNPVLLTVGNVLVALLILVGTILLVRNLPSLYECALYPRVNWDSGLRYAFLTLSQYVLILLALWQSLTAVHVSWSSLQWILAAASVGLGFGMQEIVSNFISGLILLTERPISVGDTITVGDHSGRVTRITIRATTLQNMMNQTIIVPNKEFIVSQVINWTFGTRDIRVTIPVGVAYGSDTELVQRLLLEAATQHEDVLTNPPPQVLFRAFGNSSLDWQVRFHVPEPRYRLPVTHDILLWIDHAFRKHSIEIPFPQSDIHLRENGSNPNPLTQENSNARDERGG